MVSGNRLVQTLVSPVTGAALVRALLTLALLSAGVSLAQGQATIDQIDTVNNGLFTDSLETRHLADGAVTAFDFPAVNVPFLGTGNLEDGAVTTAKLGDSIFTGGNLASMSITAANSPAAGATGVSVNVDRLADDAFMTTAELSRVLANMLVIDLADFEDMSITSELLTNVMFTDTTMIAMDLVFSTSSLSLGVDSMGDANTVSDLTSAELDAARLRFSASLLTTDQLTDLMASDFNLATMLATTETFMVVADGAFTMSDTDAFDDDVLNMLSATVDISGTPRRIIDMYISAAHIVNGDITFDDFVNMGEGVVTAEKLADNTFDATHFADNSLQSAQLSNIGSADIMAGAITSDEILDGSLLFRNFDQPSVETNLLETNMVQLMGSASLDNDGMLVINTANSHIQTNSLTNEKLADGAINTRVVQDQSISTDKIADGTIYGGTYALNSEAITTPIDQALPNGGARGSSYPYGSYNGLQAGTPAPEDLVTFHSIIAADTIHSADIKDGSIEYDNLNRSSGYHIAQAIDLLESTTVDVAVANARDYSQELMEAGVDAAIVTQVNNLINHFAGGVDSDMNPVAGGGVLNEHEDFDTLVASNKEIAVQLVSHLNEGVWAQQEIGFRNSSITEGSGETLEAFRNNSLRAQTNHFIDRFGLPDAAGDNDPNASLFAQANFLIAQRDETVKGIVIATALRDAYVPAGHRGGVSLTIASFGDSVGYGISFASITGQRSKFNFSIGGVDGGSIVRMGYDIGF